MSRENVDVVREMNAAFNAGAYDTFAEFFHPDAEFVDHLPLPEMPASARGREEVRATMDAWREGFSGFQAHVAEYVDLGDFVVAVTRWRFVSADRGVDTSWKGAEAWQLRHDRVPPTEVSERGDNSGSALRF